MSLLDKLKELVAQMIDNKMKSNLVVSLETVEEFKKCLRAVFSSLVEDSETKREILEFIDNYGEPDNSFLLTINDDVCNKTLKKLTNREDNEFYNEYVSFFNEELKKITDKTAFIDNSIKELEDEYNNDDDIKTKISKELYDALIQYLNEKIINL